MIFIATVQRDNDKWIDIQKYYISKYITSNYRIYAYLDESLKLFQGDYDFAFCGSQKKHDIKINILVKKICQDSKSNEDIIISLDGNTFPINNINSLISSILKNYQIIAICPSEEKGSTKTQPCFSITTVKYWKKVIRDWNTDQKNIINHESLNSGAYFNIFQKLDSENTKWHSLERSNKYNLHSFLFGIYGDIIYHHGIEFRRPNYWLKRFSIRETQDFIQKIIIKYISIKTRRLFPITIRRLFSEQLGLKIKDKRDVTSTDQILSSTIYYQILNDPSFIRNYFEKGVGKILVKEPKTCVIVIGMHRSGTSCLMGTLKKYGVYTSEVNLQNQYNEKGLIENSEITLLNKKVLRHNKGSWDNIPLELKWTKRHTEIRDEIINKFSGRSLTGVWGFKDPRTTLTLPFWLDGLSNYKIIASFRNPISVAQSLSNRGDLSLTHEKGLELWTSYNRTLVDLMEKHNISLVSFDQAKDEYNKRVKNILIKSHLINKDYIAEHSFYVNTLHHLFSEYEDVMGQSQHEIYQKLIQISKEQLSRDKIDLK